MKLKYTLAFLLLVLAVKGRAATSITTPTVTGHWTMAGSPYKIYNNIAITDTLLIDPGVDVIFQGYYTFTAGGGLKAVGTATSRIKFHVADTTGWFDSSTTAGGWKGIKFVMGGSSYTRFEYCDVYDMKSSGFYIQDTRLYLRNVNFYHNINLSSTGEPGPIEIWGDILLENCNIHDNWASSRIMRFSSSLTDTISLKGCNIYNNNIGYTGAVGTTMYVTGLTHGAIEHSSIYDNVSNDGGATMSLNACTVSVWDNKIYRNLNASAAAISGDNAKLDIVGNLVCNNRLTQPGTCGVLQGGGAIHLSGSTGDYIVRNNVIANNESMFQGAALCVLTCKALVANNTIVHNNGGAIFTRYGTVTMKNNLFYGNGSQIVWVSNSASLVFSHNWSENPWYLNVPNTSFVTGDTTNFVGTASGMISPTLTDVSTESALTSNFGLTGSSSCINNGDTTGADVDTVDYALQPRIYGPKIEIGAIEYQHVASVASGSAFTNEMNVYPNPATGKFYVTTASATGTLTLYDVTGRLVAQKAVERSVTDFETGTIAPGGYNMIWRSNDGTETATKVVIK